MELEINNDLYVALVSHMMECEPKECVGLVTSSNGYVKLENIHPEPERAFKVKVNDAFRLLHDPDIIAFFHSHPGGMKCPSQADMETQINFGKPGIIAARDFQSRHVEIFQYGDHLLDMPLEGVMFRQNVYDCFEIIRRHFWQTRAMKLRQVPRDPNFWMAPLEGNQNYYERLFGDFGFEQIDTRKMSPEPDDVILCQTDGSSVINHAGVYIGNNLMLHHRIGKRSGKTPVSFYEQSGYIRKWVRYVG